MKFGLWLGMVLLLGTMLAGCGGGSGTASPSRAASVTLADHLTLTLKVNTTVVSRGSSVNTQVLLTNNTAAAITSVYYGYGADVFAFPTGGVLVRASTGTVIGTDGAALIFLPLLAPMPITITLQPGETQQLSVNYTLVRTGTYTVVAQVSPTLGTPEPTASVAVTVR